MNLYKKCTAKPYFFVVIDTTIASDNFSRFRKNLLEWILKLIMTTDHKINNEKLQYNINREAAKTSALSSGKIDKNEYLRGEEILPSDQSRIIKQVKFTYSHLGKVFQKQIQTAEEQGKKQVEDLEVLKPNIQKLAIKNAISEKTLSEEAKYELNKIKEIEKKVKREKLYYRTNEYTYNYNYSKRGW